MEKYETPILQVVQVAQCDVIRTSGNPEESGDNLRSDNGIFD